MTPEEIEQAAKEILRESFEIVVTSPETPLRLAWDEDEVLEFVMSLEERMDLPIDAEIVGMAALETFGDLCRCLDSIAEIPRRRQAILSVPCATQAAFYRVRRALKVSGQWRPSSLLPSFWTTQETEQFRSALLYEAGVYLATESRVFGRLPFGWTWLSLWLVSAVLLFLVCPSLAAIGAMAIPLALLIACGLTPVTREVLPLHLRTLGDVARRVASECTTG